MGEASASVKGSAPSSSSPVPRRKDYGSGSILADCDNLVDRLDRVVEVKQDDLDTEGKTALAENHFKLGCVRAAKALVMRARALLEDYGGDLDEDNFETPDDVTGDDLKREHTDLDSDEDKSN